MNKSLMVLIIVTMMASLGWADSSGWHFKPSQNNQDKDPNSNFHKRYPAQFKDDITKDQSVDKIQLTDKQKHQAKVWDLNKSEERRYVALMRNKSGQYYQDDTPVEVLGFNARNNQERQHYAQKAAKQNFQKLAKELAFASTYNKAAAHLKSQLDMPVVGDFNYSKYSPYNYKPVNLKPHDRLMLFVHVDDAVKPIISYLMQVIQKQQSIQLNVYLCPKRGNESVPKKQVEQWAKIQNIPPQLNKTHRITLNQNNHKLQNLDIKGQKGKKTPLLLLVRNGKSRIVNTDNF